MPHRWNKAANIRRKQIESNTDITFTKVFIPYYELIVKKLSPRSLLEVGCGTGHLSLILSSHVNTIHAIDPAIDMFKTAQEVLKDTQVQVRNSDIAAHSNKEKYDLIISHMCLNTISDINTFLYSIKKNLKQNGSFIFSIPHPCFWHNYHPEWFNEFNYMKEQRLEVNLTITNEPNNPILNVPYIHRPLQDYFNALKENNFHNLGFDEFFPITEIQNLYGKPWKEPRYCAFQSGLI